MFLLSWLLTWLALADETVRIDAVVSDDLRTLTGTLVLAGEGWRGVTLRDPLADLPDPPDDRTFLRTWRGRAKPGRVVFDRVGPETWTFTTTLPRHRFGDVGSWRRGLFANGAWYPVILRDGTLPIVRWDVRVQGPVAGDDLLVVGDQVGTGTVRWQGTGARASLAVLRGGSASPVDERDTHLWIAARSDRLRRRGVERVAARLSDAELEDPSGEAAIVVIEAPLRRRLVRPGNRVLYVSDRAWRLTPGLRAYHDRAVLRGLLEAREPEPDPYRRAVLGALRIRQVPAPDSRGLLRYFAWNPVVDAILNDRRLPFWSDVFAAPHPEDPLRDDLIERYAPYGPTDALVGQLALRLSDDALARLATAIADGWPQDLARADPDTSLAELRTQAPSLADLSTGAGLAPDHLDSWRQAYPAHDLVLDVSGDVVTVRRTGPPGASGPAELARLRLRTASGVQERVFEVPRGDQVVTVSDAGALRSVVVDPDRLVRQTSRAGDAWPGRFRLITAAWIDEINLTERFLSGYATVWGRGRDDTRNVVSGTVRINQSVLPSLTIGWLHRRGPAQDGFSRPHRITTAVTGSWSNPAFADGDRAVFTVGGQLGYAWDTRVSALFPQRGRRLSVFVDGGVAPGADTWWSAGYLTGTQLVAVHPRVVLAGRARAAVARGTTTQRLLWLGGSGSGVSLKPGIAIGTERAGLEAEVRWAALRDLSVPLVGLAWLSQVQLSAGGEAVGLRTLDGQGAGVVGLTGGASFVADLLGAKPGLGGITLGVPAVVRGVVDEDGGAVRAWDSVQITVRFAQAW